MCGGSKFAGELCGRVVGRKDVGLEWVEHYDGIVDVAGLALWNVLQGLCSEAKGRPQRTDRGEAELTIMFRIKQTRARYA